MTTKISEANIQAATLDALGGGPRIIQVIPTDSSYVANASLSVPSAGGYIKITGTGFVAGAQVLFDETSASSVVFIDYSTIHAQTPVLATGNYFVYVVNPDGGTGLRTIGLTVA